MHFLTKFAIMKLAFSIARRYLFGKKTINAINIITSISVLGISIGAAALILILSVFNGFEDIISGYFNAFNPEIKITPAKGKFFSLDSSLIKKLDKIEDITTYSLVIEEVAYFEYDNSQTVGIIKGVDENFRVVNNVDTTIISGEFLLKKNGIDYCVVGNGLAYKLGVNITDKLTPLSIYTLKPKVNGPLDQFYKKAAVIPSGRFGVQSEADLKYILVPIELAQYLIGSSKVADNYKYSAIEIITNGNISSVKNKLSSSFGDNFVIQNRLEQDEALMKIMNMEKWIAYAIVSLSLFLVAINLIGSLWMIVLDKKKDISILQSMGANKKTIKRIFILVGLLISGIGLILGFVFASLFYIAQKNFGIIGIPEGSFIIESYPIELRLIDFVVVSITVLLIGFIISLLPANKAGKIPAFLREE